MRTLPLALCLALAVTTVGAHAASNGVKIHDIDRRVLLDSKKTLEIRNVTGSIMSTSHGHDGENDVNVDLAVAVPRDIDVSAGTLRGRISTEALADRPSASVVDGPIRIASVGTVRARTVTGPVQIIFGNGANAEISANTLAGGVTGDGVTVAGSIRVSEI